MDSAGQLFYNMPRYFPLHSTRLLSKVSPSPTQKEVAFSPLVKEYLRKSGAKKDKKHTTAAAQARQEGLVHSVTHRGKGIEVTKISRARRTGWT